jgi:hypothetical protein
MSERVESSLADLIATYHRHGLEKRPEDFWAWDRVGEIVRGPDAERAWELVVALVRSAPDDRLEYVGAGPVEDFVETHGAALVDWIVGEARRDPRFRAALASIWLVAEETPADVLARFQEVTGGQILVATEAELDAAEAAWLRDNPPAGPSGEA